MRRAALVDARRPYMSDTEEKSRPASKRKLQKQREIGIVARAANLGMFLGTITGCVVLIFLLPSIINDTKTLFDTTYSQMSDPFQASSANAMQDAGRVLMKIMLPIIAATLTAIVLANILNNRGILTSLTPLAPKLDRVSPKNGFTRIYGRRGWIELSVSLVSITLWMGAVVIVLYTNFGLFLRLNDCILGCMASVALQVVVPLAISAAILLMVFAGLDSLIQTNLFLHEQRMTESELKRERQEQSGSPEIRKERKRRQREDRDSAGSVGVKAGNMAFYWKNSSVAVRYHPKDAPLPRIAATAKTAEESAKLLEAIRANGHQTEENEAVVMGNLSVEAGGSAREDTFQDLALGIQRMFGKS